MGSKVITVKLRPHQLNFVTAALAKFLNKCTMRFSAPEIVKGSLQIDPHDFLELIHYVDVNFENELEVKRLKKQASQFHGSSGGNFGQNF
ncbi:MAG: hypothetical protein AB7H97_20635 [Pseudobdellovibrionaceae bacterium]